MSLPQRLRSYLKVLAARRETITYRDLAKALELDPPNAIHRVTEAVEGESGPDPAVCIEISPLRRADLAIKSPASYLFAL